MFYFNCMSRNIFDAYGGRLGWKIIYTEDVEGLGTALGSLSFELPTCFPQTSASESCTKFILCLCHILRQRTERMK